MSASGVIGAILWDTGSAAYGAVTTANHVVEHLMSAGVRVCKTLSPLGFPTHLCGPILVAVSFVVMDYAFGLEAEGLLTQLGRHEAYELPESLSVATYVREIAAEGEVRWVDEAAAMSDEAASYQAGALGARLSRKEGTGGAGTFRMPPKRLVRSACSAASG
jgi:hypothetical protein